jgi:hypothetical protein
MCAVLPSLCGLPLMERAFDKAKFLLFAVSEAYYAFSNSIGLLKAGLNAILTPAAVARIFLYRALALIS